MARRKARAGKSIVSRWEHGSPMGRPYDRLLRLMVFNEKPLTWYPKDKMADLGSGGQKRVSVRVKAADHEWKASLSAG